MGLLNNGTALDWNEAKKYADFVRKKGIKQFLNIYKKNKDRQTDSFKWGDEIEFQIVKFDHKNRKCFLLLKAKTLVPILQEPNERHERTSQTSWQPEYADYMIEGTPNKPFDHKVSCFNRLEANMNLRRNQIQEILEQDEYVLSITAFPRLGCVDFTWPNFEPSPQLDITKSLFFPDEAIYSNLPRFLVLSRNIRERRKAKVAINVPIFVDKNTPQPFIDTFNRDTTIDSDDTLVESKAASKPNHIYLDAMGFGMGCSCLQFTFQATNIDEGRHMYDQLAPLTPIMLALSAASPIWRGYLSDQDCRWNVISGAVDDRTSEELGAIPLENNKFRIFKSRYDSIDCYLSKAGEKYNDITLVKDEEIFQDLIANGIDNLMAQHIAHLFIRDPIVILKEKLDINDDIETDHFENIQSTNWQNMRFKPPPSNSDIGWRVEFRTIELQATDFENAAFTTFLLLLTRAILSFKLNLLMPISKVDENLGRAQRRDAYTKQKFYFRQNLLAGEDSPVVEMSVDEIINGSCEFPGMIQLVNSYLSLLDDLDTDTYLKIAKYLKFISMRAQGQVMTEAAWMRKFVTSHPKYKHDSVVSDEINYDLMWRMYLISAEHVKGPQFLPPVPKQSKISRCYDDNW